MLLKSSRNKLRTVLGTFLTGHSWHSGTLLCIVFFLSEETFASEWTINAQTISEAEPVVETIAVTLDHLRDSFPQDSFVLNYLDKAGLAKSFEFPRRSLFITDAVSFANYSQKHGAWALAAMKNPLAIDAAHTSGATLITRADRKDIAGLSDLQGKTLLASDVGISPSYPMVLREVNRIFGEKDFFKEVKLLNTPSQTIAHDVLASRADAGVVDACVLERMESEGNIPKNSLKVIGKRSSSDLKCAFSTDLYPGWILGAAFPPSALTPEDTAFLYRLVAALTTVPNLSNTMQWADPPQQDEVIALRKTIDGIKESSLSWQKLWDEYKTVILLLLAIVLFIATHSLYAAWQVRRKTRELVSTLKEKERLQEEIGKERDRAVLLEKSGIVSQMSSLIAHELQQPLTSIVNYARGLRVLSEKGRLTSERLTETTQEIADLGAQAAEIVQKVRGYSKKPKREPSSLNLHSFVASTVAQFIRIRGDRMQIHIDIPSDINVLADPLELKLLFSNLLKNSLDALSGSPAPKASICAQKDGARVRIVFEDNGAPVSEETANLIFTPGFSSKSDGLGLGLSICQKIAEAHKGSLSAQRTATGQLKFILEIPLADENKDLTEKASGSSSEIKEKAENRNG